MSRQKRISRVLERAKQRAVGLGVIDPALNLAGICTLEDYNQTIEQLDTKLEDYNGAIVLLGSAQAEIAELEKKLNELTERMLVGVAFKYGKDSREYEMAGGVRKSDRIRKSIRTRLKSGSEAQPAEKSLPA